MDKDLRLHLTNGSCVDIKAPYKFVKDNLDADTQEFPKNAIAAPRSCVTVSNADKEVVLPSCCITCYEFLNLPEQGMLT